MDYELARTPAISEGFQGHLNGTGDVALAVFPSPHCAGVTTQKRGKLGLRESELLAVGFEEGGGHLVGDHVAHYLAVTVGDRCNFITVESDEVLVSIFPVTLGFGFRKGRSLGEEGIELDLANVAHLTFSRVRWAEPVADDTLIHRANGPV